MADKSWGASPTPDFRIRTNASPEQRAAERAEAREARARERAQTAILRTETRSASRDAESVAREAERVARREREQRDAVGDPHAAAAARRRSSGRKDVVREQRDTRSYTTVVNVERMRELHKGGASLAGLAGAFGITVAEVEAELAGQSD